VAQFEVLRDTEENHKKNLSEDVLGATGVRSGDLPTVSEALPLERTHRY
jgi:hypothetical protein